MRRYCVRLSCLSSVNDTFVQCCTSSWFVDSKAAVTNLDVPTTRRGVEHGPFCNSRSSSSQHDECYLMMDWLLINYSIRWTNGCVKVVVCLLVGSRYKCVSILRCAVVDSLLYERRVSIVQYVQQARDGFRSFFYTTVPYLPGTVLRNLQHRSICVARSGSVAVEDRLYLTQNNPCNFRMKIPPSKRGLQNNEFEDIIY